MTETVSETPKGLSLKEMHGLPLQVRLPTEDQLTENPDVYSWMLQAFAIHDSDLDAEVIESWEDKFLEVIEGYTGVVHSSVDGVIEGFKKGHMSPETLFEWLKDSYKEFGYRLCDENGNLVAEQL